VAQYWFLSTKYRQNTKFALITFIIAFAVIVLGAYTRLTDAGLSCPDWPNCYGYKTAPHTAEQLQAAAKNYPGTPVNVKGAWTEMTHRYAAGTEGILILVLACSMLMSRYKGAKSSYLAVSLIVLLAIQVTLGMLTVTEKLKPMIVLAHLLTGLSILCALWWTYLDLQIHRDAFSIKRLRPNLLIWFWVATIIVFAQITLGGWVSTHYAGLACVDFPYCNGKILPALKFDQINSDLITIHMLHRIGAIITAIYLGLFALGLLMMKSFRIVGGLILIFIALQLTLGIMTLVYLRPVWIALLHQSVAIFLLLTVIYALIKAYIESMDTSYGL
jgi:cytochrome c oxidase assembly protein subunit 15